ncbi:peroxiredoxin-like protein DDB G0282517 [Kluyveromyces marxianus]|uniref:Peroxiredoxin-like protein DDB_G0282517 n=2 Tax=Kluyveromyces marxianus TaxID=4911 RepID=W0T8H9_KLUMD|nr:peroxiredoxin family protein [Kluyveromyces marxianus DMKU3-1042]QGN15640.1 peroxiredoxin-like protein DDB_G0282517 [Kluyveromyces marxianus]BAO39927.1 peroxiredoxin-like protein DDB_G0282517 [Kluyveromyces marxianus DMKU3-1042]BAP71408.1 peroxiredoxin-like protein DDB G0282517 [Kluyveromyces marxianus]
MTSILPKQSIYIGAKAPNFQSMTSMGAIDFYQYTQGKWCIFFSHPADFTPICTTEIGAFGALQDEFTARDCVLLGLSTNDKASHLKWIQDIESITGISINFPIICDEEKKVATQFSMIDLHALTTGKPQLIPLRTVYIIDPNKIVRLIQIYPLSTGRNTAEILRCLDSLQLVYKTNGKIMTPINWIPGDDIVVVPDVKSDEMFPKKRTIRDYLQLSPLDPNSV